MKILESVVNDIVKEYKDWVERQYAL